MKKQPEPMIIQGNFAPATTGRFFRVSTRLLSIFFVVLGVVALVAYGIKVQFEDSINKLAKHTRDMNEQNKELQVKLNHIRSYKNVEAAVAQVPHLRMPETVIEIPPSATPAKLPPMPRPKQEIPRVYGY
jgi:hypothetical protein